MNKTDLTKVVSETTGLNKKEVATTIDAAFEVITQELANGGEVNIAGFAKLGVKPTAERKGRNPQTGEEIVIPASKKPTFKPAKNLKEQIK